MFLNPRTFFKTQLHFLSGARGSMLVLRALGAPCCSYDTFALELMLNCCVFLILCVRFANQARVRSKLSLFDFAVLGGGGGGKRLVRELML